jgi:hypothetical protein
MKTIQTIRREKNGKVYYSLDNKTKAKLFNMPIEIVFAREMQGRYGQSVFAVATLPEEFKPVYENQDGEQVEATDCTAVGFSLPVRLKNGKEFGAGIELLQIVRETEEGTKPKVVIKEETGVSKDGNRFRVYKVVKA